MTKTMSTATALFWFAPGAAAITTCDHARRVPLNVTRSRVLSTAPFKAPVTVLQPATRPMAKAQAAHFRNN